MNKGCFICRKPVDKVFIFKTPENTYKLCRNCMVIANRLKIDINKEKESN